MQVDPTTVASDSFMINIQSILLSFAEPFMDATYSKVMDAVALSFAHVGSLQTRRLIVLTRYT